MKKSESYHMAQVAVVLSPSIAPEKKLEILRVLMDAEDLELYCEEKEMERMTAEIEKEIAAEMAADEE
jgi:hypothetical protein